MNLSGFEPATPQMCNKYSVNFVYEHKDIQES